MFYCKDCKKEYGIINESMRTSIGPCEYCGQKRNKNMRKFVKIGDHYLNTHLITHFSPMGFEDEATGEIILEQQSP